MKKEPNSKANILRSGNFISCREFHKKQLRYGITKSLKALNTCACVEYNALIMYVCEQLLPRTII